MDAKQIIELVAQLAAIAAAYSKNGSVQLIVELANVASRLNNMIAAVREQNPEAWKEISENYGDALARFEASVKTKEGE